MEAEELARAQEAARQTTRQAQARRARERAMAGSTVARKELAADYAAVSEKERRRAGTITIPPEVIVAFVGEGPPPEDIPAQPGDNYLDAESGDLYTLGD